MTSAPWSPRIWPANGPASTRTRPPPPDALGALRAEVLCSSCIGPISVVANGPGQFDAGAAAVHELHVPMVVPESAFEQAIPGLRQQGRPLVQALPKVLPGAPSTRRLPPRRRSCRHARRRGPPKPSANPRASGAWLPPQASVLRDRTASHHAAPPSAACARFHGSPQLERAVGKNARFHRVVVVRLWRGAAGQGIDGSFSLGGVEIGASSWRVKRSRPCGCRSRSCTRSMVPL